MENQSTPQPRDSRMEQFATTARNIIMTERGLTATALIKIGSLAKHQRLSNEQVETCLSQISSSDSSLGRVGRYEQLFLDRMAIELPAISNAYTSGVLSPVNERQAIQIAVDEFQIKETRAKQLLSFSAKQHGLRQVSAADAKAKMRERIADRMDSCESQLSELASEISRFAERFGISKAEVDELIETETAARQKQRRFRNRWLFCGVLCSAGLAIAGWFCGPAFLTLSTPDASTNLQSSAPKTEVAPPISATDGEQTIANAGTIQRSDQPQDPVYGVDEFQLLLEEVSDDGSIKELKQWQQHLVQIANQPLITSDLKPTEASLADRRKKNEAIAALQAEDTDSRTQVRGLEDLSDLTTILTDITAAEAKQLAQFCLQSNSDELQMAVQRKIDRFGRWPNFLLALSDQLEDDSANALTTGNQPPSNQQWQQRIALLITKRDEPKSGRLSDAIFKTAHLRLQENVLSQLQRDNTAVMKSEQLLVTLVRRFISAELTNPFEQRYFYRLIDNGDLTAMSMRRRLELQQILIEAISFAHANVDVNASAEAGAGPLKTAGLYFRNIQTATTIGQQLVQSQQAMLKLSTIYLAKRQQNGESNNLQISKTQRLVTVEEARELRDRAELAALSEDQSQLATAIEDYQRSAACGDSAIARSCLRGLIAITNDPQKKQQYRRQFDFVAGGQMGPCNILSAAKHEAATESELRKIIKFCQQIRREEMINPQTNNLSSDLSKNPSENLPQLTKTLWAVLNKISEQPQPISMTNLALVVQIESAAKLAAQTSEELRIEFELPWQMQALLPPIGLTPLVPLQR